MREQRRLSVIIQAANARLVPPIDIEFADVSQHESLFTMIILRKGLWGILVPVIFIAGMTTALVLIVLQYARLVVSF